VRTGFSEKKVYYFSGGCVWLMLPYTGCVLSGFLCFHRTCAGVILSFKGAVFRSFRVSVNFSSA
jgi:hypothetical protein